jgi:hypothetical protein
LDCWDIEVSRSPHLGSPACAARERTADEEELREEKRDTESGRHTQSFGARVEGVEIG